MIDIKTFGETPAAEHLVRQLNQIENEGKRKLITRSVGVIIKGYNNNILELRRAVKHFISPKVAANLLRLLREEASKIEIKGADQFTRNLVRNIVIGNIKKAIREVTVLRKIENATSSVEKVKKKAKQIEIFPEDNVETYSVLGYRVGFMLNGKWFPQTVGEIEDTVTPELLHKRSESRRLRRERKSV